MTATAKTRKKPAPKAKPKKRTPPPDMDLDELMGSLNREGELEDGIRQHEAAIEELRVKLKAEKELRAGKLADLRRMVWERKHPEALPLFNGKASKNGSPKGEGKPAVAGPSEEDQSWRDVPIKEALPKLGKKVYEGMERLQLDTLGKLIDWKNAKPERWWTEIDGIGKAACDKLDDAIEAFFTARKKVAETVQQVADAANPDALEAARAVRWSDDTFGVLRDLEPYEQELARFTVGDVLDAAAKAKRSPLDYLRSIGFSLPEADMLLDAARRAGKGGATSKGK